MGSLAFASRMELTAETTASKLIESPSRKKPLGAHHIGGTFRPCSLISNSTQHISMYLFIAHHLAPSWQTPPERPQSDAQVFDKKRRSPTTQAQEASSGTGGVFVPKLPPKKKVLFLLREQ